MPAEIAQELRWTLVTQESRIYYVFISQITPTGNNYVKLCKNYAGENRDYADVTRKLRNYELAPTTFPSLCWYRTTRRNSERARAREGLPSPRVCIKPRLFYNRFYFTLRSPLCSQTCQRLRKGVTKSLWRRIEGFQRLLFCEKEGYGRCWDRIYYKLLSNLTEFVTPISTTGMLRLCKNSSNEMSTF